MAFRKEGRAEVEAEVESRVIQDHHLDQHLLSTGKAKATRHRVAPNPTAAPGVAVILPRDSSTTVLVTKALK